MHGVVVVVGVGMRPVQVLHMCLILLLVLFDLVHFALVLPIFFTLAHLTCTPTPSTIIILYCVANAVPMIPLVHNPITFAHNIVPHQHSLGVVHYLVVIVGVDVGSFSGTVPSAQHVLHAHF